MFMRVSKSCKYLPRFLSGLFILCLSFVAHGASFDCSKASTKVEKIICSNQELSKLDDSLGEDYADALNAVSGKKRIEFISKQVHWMKDVRDKCSDKECLVKAYKARLNILDPFYDDSLTCSEMENRATDIFTAQDTEDLGSGYVSPLAVDYRCKQSIASKPFMKHLLALAETIRGEEELPEFCSGSIVHALWRYYQFDLTKAGFAPKRFLAGAIDAQTPSSLSQMERYFRQWSEESSYNFRLYNQFRSESKLAKRKLTHYYETSLNLPADVAKPVAQEVIYLIVGRAAGSFPKSALKSESRLVKLARDPTTKPTDVLRFFQDSEANHIKNTPDEIYRALKVALLNKRSPHFVNSLLAHLTAVQLGSLSQSGEPLLSFAIHDPALLKLLLQHHVPVDAQNAFGKTALFYAIQYNEGRSVRLLLAHGADVNHAYKTAKELRSNGDQCSYPTIAHTGRTPLMHAAQINNVAMLKLLVKHGADIHADDDLHYNALDYAFMGKNKKNEVYLKSLGLEQDHPIFPFKKHASVLNINSVLSIPGYVSELKISSARPSILIASVGPFSTNKPNKKDGVYFLSLRKPSAPKILSYFPHLHVDHFVVGPSGEMVYALQLSYASSAGGVYVINAKNPDNPVLKEFIKGDFCAMHLSRGGKYLYLQETAGSGGSMQVYQLASKGVGVLCSNPFHESLYNSPVAAYVFANLPNHRLAINVQGRRIYVFRVDGPCKSKQLFSPAHGNFGDMAGLEDGTLIEYGFDGLIRYRFSSTPHIIGTYSTPSGVQLEVTTINKAEHVVAAIFTSYSNSVEQHVEHEVGLLKMSPDGHFLLMSAYRLPNRMQTIGSLLLDHKMHLYLGLKGALLEATVPVMH